MPKLPNGLLKDLREDLVDNFGAADVKGVMPIIKAILLKYWPKNVSSKVGHPTPNRGAERPQHDDAQRAEQPKDSPHLCEVCSEGRASLCDRCHTEELRRGVTLQALHEVSD